MQPARKEAKKQAMRFHFSPVVWLLVLAPFLVACGTRTPAPRRPPPAPPEILARAAAFDLIDVSRAIPNLDIVLPYASSENVAGRPVYPQRMPCLLRRSTAQKLAYAQHLLKQQGYGLLLWDAWRPPEAQITLISQAPHPELFMDPKENWSGHCAGVSVDVTLVDSMGRPQLMPTGYDESSPHTGYRYQGGSTTIAHNLHRLQSAMHQAGFSLLSGEWWHFDDKDFLSHPTPVVSAEQIGLALP